MARTLQPLPRAVLKPERKPDKTATPQTDPPPTPNHRDKDRHHGHVSMHRVLFPLRRSRRPARRRHPRRHEVGRRARRLGVPGLRYAEEQLYRRRGWKTGDGLTRMKERTRRNREHEHDR
ncbi:hypothetical protein ebA2751 [Aromatoleum aromaticum EbN1]|uniref:Uncharacterized protein n=1 Tax=Aromatoleum aromaticum (strain DSM 19018 / LMG 30748 / EbN1) TaxID=76114 RepID=Q5P4U2_AROAE|nr:hypothetical protein ebA2751 [Aromatoleum aromaticum EbN1]